MYFHFNSLQTLLLQDFAGYVSLFVMTRKNPNLFCYHKYWVILQQLDLMLLVSIETPSSWPTPSKWSFQEVECVDALMLGFVETTKFVLLSLLLDPLEVEEQMCIFVIVILEQTLNTLSCFTLMNKLIITFH